LAARIRKCVAFSGPSNRSPSRLLAAKHIQSRYAP
jgi:hypothetical protein